MYAYTHLQMCICIYIYIFIYVNMHIDIIHIPLNKYKCILYIYIFIHIQIYIHTCLHIFTCIAGYANHMPVGSRQTPYVTAHRKPIRCCQSFTVAGLPLGIHFLCNCTSRRLFDHDCRDAAQKAPGEARAAFCARGHCA